MFNLKSFFSCLLLLPCLLTAENQQQSDPDLLTKRHKLEIVNNTHIDEGARGRDLYLIWTKHVHQPPRYTERLIPGAKEGFHSQGIGRGNKPLGFHVDVYYWKGDEKCYIGDFLHWIISDPFENGHTEVTEIFKNYTENEVHIWRKYSVRTPSGPQTEYDYIGPVPREEWDQED